MDDVVSDLAKRIWKKKEYVSSRMAHMFLDDFIRSHGFTFDEFRSHIEKNMDSLIELCRLSPEVRKCFSNSAAYNQEEQHFLAWPILYWIIYVGPLSFVSRRVIRLGWQLKVRGQERVGDGIIWVGRLMVRACRPLARKAIRLISSLPLLRKPLLIHIFEKLSIPIDWIMDNALLEVPINISIGPIYKKTDMNSESAAIVGIDFLSSNGKMYFIEANFNAGYNDDRLSIFSQGDPVCRNLIKYATENSYKTIKFYPTQMYGYLFPRKLEVDWQNRARVSGLNLMIIDDPVNGSPYNRRASALIEPFGKNELHVNNRFIESPLGRTVCHKGNVEKLLDNYDGCSACSVVGVPKRILSQMDLEKIDSNLGYPNVILKNSMLDQSKGIRLFRVDKFSEIAMKWPFQAYQYVVPDCVCRSNNGKEEKFVYIFRAYLLLTADRSVFLGCRKDISTIAVPVYDGYGEVDKAPFIANASYNAKSVEPSIEEYEKVGMAAEFVGRVLVDYQKRIYSSLFV